MIIYPIMCCVGQFETRGQPRRQSMSRRITSLLAASTLVAGLAVGVPAARAIPSDHGAADTVKTTATTTQSTPDPQKLIALLGQVEREIKHAQQTGKVSPHDVGGLSSLISGIEASVLGLLNTVTTSLGLPPLPGLPGTSGLPAATQLEQSVKDAMAKMSPADLGGLGGL